MASASSATTAAAVAGARKSSGRKSYANAQPSKSMLSFSSPAGSPSMPPPTPTRALLERIRRRSSLAPSLPSSSASTSTSSHAASEGGAAASRARRGRSSLGAQPLSQTSSSSSLQASRRKAATEGREGRDTRHSMAITEEDEGATSELDQDEEPDSDPDVQEPAYRQETSSEGQDYLDALDNPEAEQAALERQVDQLIELSEAKDDRIVLLEQQLADAQKSAKVEKERVRLLEKRSEKGSLTRQAAVTLEREFASQELILKGLQRDNESKTLEVETLRRRLRTLTDFLISQYGEADWETVVASRTSSAGVPPMPDDAVLKRTGDEEEGNSIANLQREMMGLQHAGSPTPIARLLASENQGQVAEETSFRELQERATQLIQAGSLTSTAGQQRAEGLETQTPISSPNRPRGLNSSYTTAAAGDTSNASEEPDVSTHPAGTPARQGTKHRHGGAGAGTGDGIWNKQMLLSSIESVRLLVQAFEKQNALRKVELEQILIGAREAEQRLGEMQQGPGGEGGEEAIVA